MLELYDAKPTMAFAEVVESSKPFTLPRKPVLSMYSSNNLSPKELSSGTVTEVLVYGAIFIVGFAIKFTPFVGIVLVDEYYVFSKEEVSSFSCRSIEVKVSP